MVGELKAPPKKMLKKFFHLINERHLVYLRRRNCQPWPWTRDPILRKHRFCNVFRELDKVTIWIREQWREPYSRDKNLWFAMAVARQINWPETLEEIGYPWKWNPNRVASIIRNRRARGLKTYTSAYMLTGTLGGDKAEQTVFKILDPLYRNPPPIHRAKTLEEAFRMFKGRPGFGPFLSYEVVTDLRHTRYLRRANDIMTWANAGPGAVRGLHRLWGRPLVGRKRQAGAFSYTTQQSLTEMRYLLEASPQYLLPHVPPLEMRDIEHCLCEWDKYERVRKGEGTIERYDPSFDLG